MQAKPPPGDEGPMADYPPFAEISDEVWQNAQRRRRIIRQLDELAGMARDEKIDAAFSVLSKASQELRLVMFQASANPQPIGAIKKHARRTQVERRTPCENALRSAKPSNAG